MIENREYRSDAPKAPNFSDESLQLFYKHLKLKRKRMLKLPTIHKNLYTILAEESSKVPQEVVHVNQERAEDSKFPSNVPTNVLLLCWTRIATYKAINNRWAEHTCQKLDRRWDSGRNDEFSVSRTREQRLLQQQSREVEYWVDKYVWGGGQNLWRDDQANTVHGGPIPGQNHSWHPLQKRSGRGRKRNRPTTGRLPDHRSSKVLAQNIKY